MALKLEPLSDTFQPMSPYCLVIIHWNSKKKGKNEGNLDLNLQVHYYKPDSISILAEASCVTMI